MAFSVKKKKKKTPACLPMQEMWVRNLGWADPLEEGTQPTPVFLPRESYGQSSLTGYSPWGCKDSDTTEATQHAWMQVYLRASENRNASN